MKSELHKRGFMSIRHLLAELDKAAEVDRARRII